MAMLAEKKYKNKWSNDPRNRNWSKDTTRFGYQMLEKMGWKSGKGLGAKEDGQTSHVKISKKNDNIGLGADKSNVDNWLEHQQAFDSLLAELNQSGNSEGKSENHSEKKHKLQEKAKKSKRRVNYHRFVKSKDLSSYTDTDMACILGQRPSQTAPPTPLHDETEDSESDSGSTVSCPAINTTNVGLKTINSGLTMQEYFAQKMKDLQAKRNEQNDNFPENNCIQTAGNDCEQDDSLNTTRNDDKRKGKSKKKKRKLVKSDLVQGETSHSKYDAMREKETGYIAKKRAAPDEENDEEESSEGDCQERKPRRKERKLKNKESKPKRKKKKKQKDKH